MDEFIKDIEDCLGSKGYTLKEFMETDTILKDAEANAYNKADECLLKEYKTILATGNIDKLLKFIHTYNKNISTMCLDDTLIINVYSHNPKTEWPIDSQTLLLNKYEQKLMQAYDLMIDILY